MLALLLLIRLCKQLLRHYAQVGAHVEVDYLHVNYFSGPPLSEDVGAYDSLRLCRYCYLYQPSLHISHPLFGPFISPAPLGLSTSVPPFAIQPQYFPPVQYYYLLKVDRILSDGLGNGL